MASTHKWIALGLLLGFGATQASAKEELEHEEIDLPSERIAEIKMFPPPNSLPFVVEVAAPMASIEKTISKSSVTHAANLVADWQIRYQDQYLNSPLTTFQGTKRFSFGGWLMGTMAIGMTEWGLIDGNDKYLDFIVDEAEKFNYGVEVRIFDADDYCIGQAYLELAEKYPNKVDLKPLQERLDYIYENWPTVHKKADPACETLESHCRVRWTWIDALFMGAPVWTHMAKTTGDDKYLKFAEYEFWASVNRFIDKEEGLLYRDSRFVDRPDPWGKKVFWSRGNGWVFASLARILETLPETSEKRADYEKLMVTMARALVKCQQPSGAWHPSLLHPERYNMPENSGGAFFVYGMAWGINNGVLDAKEFMPAINKAWPALTESIYADGRFGYVQPSGFDPRWVKKEETDVYGVGAFLLACSELYKLPTTK